MKHIALTIALLGVVGTAPSFAQPMPSAPASGTPTYGYTPPAGTPVTPDNQGGNGSIPPVGKQIRAAKSLGGKAEGRSPDNLLRQADAALKGHKIAVANELLERAQTASLNGQQPGAGMPDSKMTSGIADARQAMIGGDIAGARQHIAEALGNTAPERAPPSRRGHQR